MHSDDFHEAGQLGCELRGVVCTDGGKEIPIGIPDLREQLQEGLLLSSKELAEEDICPLFG